MRITRHYQSQLLFRKSYKPKRIVRVRPAAQTKLLFRPVRAGFLCRLYECKTD